jgi:hypothetical protein
MPGEAKKLRLARQRSRSTPSCGPVVRPDEHLQPSSKPRFRGLSLRLIVVLGHPDLIDKMGIAHLPSILFHPRALSVAHVPDGLLVQPFRTSG